MQQIGRDNFGILIAYLLPGFTVLWGLSHVSETVQVWMGMTASGGPTIGGFFYVTLGSVGAGMTVSAVRWLVVDTIHHRTGLTQPR